MKQAQILFAEFLGTAFLLAVIVGSGVMGERLGGGNQALVLLVNSTATGAGLIALILAFAPASGAHFNPLVSGLMAARAASLSTARSSPRLCRIHSGTPFMTSGFAV